jgi:hypothetical protein
VDVVLRQCVDENPIWLHMTVPAPAPITSQGMIPELWWNDSVINQQVHDLSKLLPIESAFDAALYVLFKLR